MPDPFSLGDPLLERGESLLPLLDLDPDRLLEPALLRDPDLLELLEEPPLEPLLDLLPDLLEDLLLPPCLLGLLLLDEDGDGAIDGGVGVGMGSSPPNPGSYGSAPKLPGIPGNCLSPSNALSSTATISIISFEKLAIRGSHERLGSGPGSLQGLLRVFLAFFGDALGDSTGSLGSGVGSLGVGVFGGLLGSGDGSLERNGLSSGPQGSGVGSLGVGVLGGSIVGDGVEALDVEFGFSGGGGVGALGLPVGVGALGVVFGSSGGGVLVPVGEEGVLRRC